MAFQGSHLLRLSLSAVFELLISVCVLVHLPSSLLAYDYFGAPAVDGVYDGDSCSYYLGRAIVQFTPGVDIDSATSTLQQYAVEPYVAHMIGDFVWCCFDTALSVDSVIDVLETDSLILRASPDYVLDYATFPSDPYYDNDSTLQAQHHYGCSPVQATKFHQWNLAYNGPYAFPIPDSPFVQVASHMRVRAAWDITQGNPSVRVLHLDVGMRHVGGIADHEDFDTAHVKVGRNYVSSDSASLAWGDTLKGEEGWHGTQSVGLIAATLNNEKGIAGIAPGCITYGATVGGVGSLVSGMTSALSLDIDVVSTAVAIFDTNSLGVLETAVGELYNHDILVIGSHGNIHNARNFPGYLSYWDSQNGIGGGYGNVLNVNSLHFRGSPMYYHVDDTLAVTLIAPGSPNSIPSVHQCRYDSYAYYGYTSAASPQVAGVAALVMSHFGVGAGEARQILVGTADKLWKDTAIVFDPPDPWLEYYDDDYHSNYGYGRVNAFRALNGWHGTIDSTRATWDTLTLFANDNRVYIADLSVEPNCTLLVSSGIEVRAITTDIVDGTENGDENGYPCELVVEGHLDVTGTPSDSVLFSSTNDTLLPAWAGIHVKAGGSLKLRYAQIENAKIGIKVDSGGVIDTLIGCSFINCGTAIEMATDTLLVQNVTVNAPSDFAVLCDEDSQIRVLGSFAVNGSSSVSATFSCRNDSTVGSWVGIRVLSGGSLDFEHVKITNAETAICVDSGGIIDTPLVHLTLDDCGVGLDVQSGLSVLRDVAMTGIVDFGVYAVNGNPEIVLDSPVVIQGTPNASVGVSIGTDARLTASYATVEDGYIGFEVEGDRVDNISHCTITGQTFAGIWFKGSDSVDQSAYNVISKDTAGSLDYGILIMYQSVASNRDSIAGGYSRNVRFLSNSNSAKIDSLRVIGVPGDGYGVFLDGGSGADSAFLYNPEVDGFFNTAHVYVYDIHAEIEDGSVVTDTSSAAVSPYGIYDRWNTTGRVRCTDILNQAVACAYRYDSSCSLRWGAPNYNSTASYNYIYTPIDSAWLFKNDPGDSVDARRNYWGADPPDTSRIDTGVDWGMYLAQEQCGGPIVHEEKTAADRESEPVLPLHFALEQNIPNPFNPTTEIRFALPRDQAVTITIYNVLGRVVRTLDLGNLPAGYRSVIWDGKTRVGKAAGSGVYFYRLTTPEFQDVKKMLLLK